MKDNVFDKEKFTIESNINQAFDRLLEEYEEERIILLNKIAELEVKNEKLKRLVDKLSAGKPISRNGYTLYKVRDID